eukprot:1139458-Pelagomonas_calceolata.AAC.1
MSTFLYNLNVYAAIIHGKHAMHKVARCPILPWSWRALHGGHSDQGEGTSAGPEQKAQLHAGGGGGSSLFGMHAADGGAA